MHSKQTEFVCVAAGGMGITITGAEPEGAGELGFGALAGGVKDGIGVIVPDPGETGG